MRAFPRHALGCALLLALISIGGCASMPSDGGETAASAEALFREGDLRAAAVAFVDAANGSRRDRHRLLLRAAEAWRENGDGEAVQNLLPQIDSRRLNADEALRLALLRAEIALDAGDPTRALELLSVAPASVARSQRARFHELRGRALESDDPFAAAVEFARLDGLLDGSERRDNARRIRSTLARLGDDPLSRSAALLAANDPLRPFAARALSARGLSVPASLRDGGTRPARSPGSAGVTRIALLLPLSGPLQAVAEPVRDGFLAARFAAGDGAPSVDLLDSGGTAESALVAYRQAVSSGADLVVGPLTRDEVNAVLSERDLPVPLLALNRSVGPLPPGHLSFALTPEDEAAAVARLLAQRGLFRVVAVGGRDELAQRTLEAFSARHLQAGGELLASAILPPTGVDYRAELRAALAGAGLPTEAPVDLSVPHDPGFDAVFLAVRPEQARLLVPQLKLAGLIGLPMIGTSMLHALDDASRQDRELDGVEFSELPWLVEDRPGLPPRGPLRAQLDSASGASARLFAFGMDAWRLLQSHGALVDADLPLAAATGDLSLDAFGEARSQPIIARFRGGTARPLQSGGLRPD
jgi:outer membrane PBP1 activator LpoA protein